MSWKNLCVLPVVTTRLLVGLQGFLSVVVLVHDLTLREEQWRAKAPTHPTPLKSCHKAVLESSFNKVFFLC